MNENSKRKCMLYNIKTVYLHCVFHGIRFKVNNEDWLSVKMAFFVFCTIRNYPIFAAESRSLVFILKRKICVFCLA